MNDIEHRGYSKLRARSQMALLLSQCAWCLAIRIDGIYHRCPAIPLMDSDNVTHGICPTCRDNLVADMGRMLD